MDIPCYLFMFGLVGLCWVTLGYVGLCRRHSKPLSHCAHVTTPTETQAMKKKDDEVQKKDTIFCPRRRHTFDTLLMDWSNRRKHILWRHGMIFEES